MTLRERHRKPRSVVWKRVKKYDEISSQRQLADRYLKAPETVHMALMLAARVFRFTQTYGM